MTEEMVRENVNYDAENDVLYINFHDPPLEAQDSRRVGRFILRYRFGEFIGMTIVDASSLLDDAQSSESSPTPESSTTGE